MTVASVIVVALFALAFYSGHHWLTALRAKASDGSAVVLQQTEEMRRALADHEAGKLARLPRPDPGRPGVVNYLTNPYYVKPEGPLAITAVGESDVRPSVTRLGHPADPTLQHHDILSYPALAIGRLDLAFVVVAVLPLLVIGLMFRLYSAEQESGTLPLLRGQPISLARVLLFRTLLRYGALSGVVFATFGVGLVVSGEPTSVSWMLLWALVVGLYLAVWFCLGLIVSLLRLSSGANIVVLTGMWVAFIVLIPALVNIAASSTAQLPSRAEILIEYRRILEHEERDEAMITRFLDKWRPAWADPQLPPSGPSTAYLALQDHAREQVAAQLAQVARSRTARQQFVERLQGLSPAISTQNALLGLAGTDSGAFDQLEAEAAREHDRRDEFFVPLVINGARMQASDYDQIPTPAPPSRPGHVSWPSVIALLATVVGLSVVVALRLRSL